MTLEPLVELRRTGEKLPDSLRDAILALGNEAVGPLLEVLEDESALEEDSPSEGWAPIHAAKLLVDLRANEAIEPLLRVLKSVDYEAIIYNVIVVNLSKFGAPVLEPALRMIEQGLDEAPLDGVCGILSSLGVRDERIYENLKLEFEREPVLGAICFANYGDKRALPMLRKAIEQFEPGEVSRLGIYELKEFSEAYTTIAGELPPDLASRCELLSLQWNELQDAIEREERQNAPAVSTKIGRNEPCPCGSGKKYKKCCGKGTE